MKEHSDLLGIVTARILILLCYLLYVQLSLFIQRKRRAAHSLLIWHISFTLVFLFSDRGGGLRWSFLSPKKMCMFISVLHLCLSSYMLTIYAGRDTCLHLPSQYITSRFFYAVIFKWSLDIEQELSTLRTLVWPLHAHG